MVSWLLKEMMHILINSNNNKFYQLKLIKNKLKLSTKTLEKYNILQVMDYCPYLKELQEEELNLQFVYVATVNQNIC